MEFLLIVALVAVGVAWTAYSRVQTRKALAKELAEQANQEVGCIACHSKNLRWLGNGKVRCADCEYEGQHMGGERIHEDEVEGFAPYPPR